MDKPDVDSIEGLSPAIAIEQKASSHNPRSTVGTVTEIYDYLRLLYARAGMPRCPDHGIELTAQTVSQMVDQVLRAARGHGRGAARAGRERPQGRARRSCSRSSPRRASCACASTGGSTRSTRCRSSIRRSKHTIEAVVDRMRVRPDAGQRLAESFETALRLSDGLARLVFLGRARARAAGVLEPPRLPGVRLQRAAARAEAVLLQQPDRRLPELRRTRRAGVLRSAARRRAPAPVARRRRGARLGPAQRALLPADPVARAPLRLRHRDALDRAARARAARAAVRQRRPRPIEFQLPRRRPATARASAIPSRASCPTSSGATARPQSPTVREELAQVPRRARRARNAAARA